jgi:DNA helicase-2/ATP-dependent DNA helicase PcrA
MALLWRAALGVGREPSADQEAAIVAPPTGRHCVNAGAGTGKTSTLALRALYLIEAGHVRADEIVVVTFTKKAAAEIGSRIADTIDRASANGARFSGESQGVTCTTIHALAAEILREFAFEFGSVAPARAISDGEAYSIFHDAFRALLDGHLAVDTAAFPVAEITLANLERDLGKLALRLKNHGIAPSLFQARALAEADRFEEQTWGQLWTDGAGRNRGRRKDQKPKVPVTPEQRACEAARERENIRVVTTLFTEFDRRLAQRGAATYGDLIGITTRQLRERPEIVTRLRARWRYLLLDESQDTSDLQLAFIETLFGAPGDPDACGMMPVGDTRQAIYGFNGADEQVMERLAEVADATHPLVVNRRSLQEIVDAGHAVLENAGIVAGDTPKLKAAAGSGGLGCVRVENFAQAGETIKEHVERESAAIAREVQRLLRDPSTNESDIAILVRRRTHAAAYVRALNLHGIRAALDRRSGLFVADEIRDALAWMSLLLDLGDGQAAVRILQSPLCGLNDAAMIALTDRKDWLDRFLRDDLGKNGDADTRSRLDRVREWLTALLPTVALPLPAAMAQILAQLPIAASYTRLTDAIGAQAIINLRSFELLAREFADEQPGARLRDFVDDAKRRILYDDEPQEPELELNGVRVLTIHQAKGLEWPFVFVACSTKYQYGNADPTDRVVNYDLRSGAFGLKNDVDGRETFRWLTMGSEHDPNTGERLTSARAAAAARAQARVFYVALTRAKRRVYITAPAPAAGPGEAPYLAAIRAWAESIEPGVDLGFDAPSIADPEKPRERNAPLVTERAPTAAMPTRKTLRPRVSFTAISAFETCPRMARLRYRLLLPDLREARPRFVGSDALEGAMPTNAARLGSLAHRALELWGRATIEARPVALDEAFESARLEFADATADEMARARASARHAVDALAGYTPLAVEEPFEIAFGTTRVEGVIDLIARDPSGQIVVIDYKTGRTQDEHYALQMALYRRVAALRYPDERVSGAILRLTPDGATFAFAPTIAPEELDRAIADVGLFESDVANVGAWCDTCSYRGSPCMAPVRQVV